MKRLAIALIVLVTLSGCEVLYFGVIPMLAYDDYTLNRNLDAIDQLKEKTDGGTRNRVEATAGIQ